MFNPLKPQNINNQVYPAPSQFQIQQSQTSVYPMCQNFNTKNEYSPLMNIQQQQQMRFQIYNNNQNMSHCKSYSLPANFQDVNQQQQFMLPTNMTPKMQPPPRLLSGNGDIPLPSGWELEKTASGQAYYIKYV